MGKKKVEMKARGTKEGKQVTFAKRRMGLEKKAQQLSILCDIPLLLLLFSPAQRLSWISSSCSTPEELLMSYANIPFEEREKRKLEVLVQLNRVFRNTDHQVDVEKFLWHPPDTSRLKELLTHVQKIRTSTLQTLREYETPKTFEHANQLEGILQIRLQQIRMYRQLVESSRYIASLNQMLIEEQPLPVSNQHIRTYSETLGQQKCSEDPMNFVLMDATSRDTWERNNMPPAFGHGSIPLLAHQGAPDIASSCLPNSSVFMEGCFSDTLDPLGKQQPISARPLPTCLDHVCYQNGEMPQESPIFQRDAAFDPLSSVGEDHPFGGDPLFRDQDLSANNILHHDPRFQPLFEFEDVNALNLPPSNFEEL